MEPDTNTQSIPPTDQPVLVQAPIPKKHNPSILLWILVLTLAGIASYFGYQYWQLRQQISQIQPTLATLVTPTVTSDPVANWKTYTNTQIGAIIKYPPNWTYKESSNGKSVDFNTSTTSPETVEENPINYYVNLQLEDYSNFQAWSKDISTKTLPPITINKLEFTRYIAADKYYSLNYIYIDAAGKIFRFYISPYTQTETKTPLDMTMAQVLSTFKFTNQTSKIPNSIDVIFTAINSTFGSNIVPMMETEFYSMQGFVDKESWKLDLTSVLTDKSQFTVLRSALEKNLKEDINSAADGVGQGVQGYENDQIYCFLLRGFNASDYLSCVEK